MMRAFDRNQKQMISAVAVIEVLRMFGIFLVVPVFTLYGKIYTDSSILIGIALGAYGLTMALFQAPFGILSDRFGRKNVIILGMIPYIIGNLIAWHPFNIYGLIIGRLVAGAGAVTSSGMAMVQESVPQNRRNIAMAILGIPIGFSFMVGLVLGPYLSGIFGPSFLFLLSGILGIAGIFPMMRVKYRKPEMTAKERRSAGRIQGRAILVGAVGFLISLYMIVFFYYLPLYGTSAYGTHGYDLLLLWPVIIGGIVAVGSSGFADRGKTTMFSVISLAVMLVSVPLVFLAPHYTGNRNWFFVGAIVFFSGFSIYEIVFYPLISRISKRDSYGANIGIYNTMQFSGQFIGGVSGGILVTLTLTEASLLRTTVTLSIIVALSLIFLYLATHFREITRNPDDKGDAATDE
ncbi:hypothetical protein IX51_01730 [uncultured archaeon]|nr:hypothetical protein IX51_01730 [uncultured archaeon]